jgi:hypothetical protein
MRPTLVSFVLLGCAYTLASNDESDALQTKVDAYIQEVGQIVRDALMPELAEHRELGDVIKEFSFRIDAAGHPNEIKATSIPPTKFLDQLVIRVIRGLKFPPIPKEILEKYPDIEFRTRMGPPGSIGSNQALERTADRRERLLSMTSTLKTEAPLALVSGRSACSR